MAVDAFTFQKGVEYTCLRCSSELFNPDKYHNAESESEHKFWKIIEVSGSHYHSACFEGELSHEASIRSFIVIGEKDDLPTYEFKEYSGLLEENTICFQDECTTNLSEERNLGRSIYASVKVGEQIQLLCKAHASFGFLEESSESDLDESQLVKQALESLETSFEDLIRTDAQCLTCKGNLPEQIGKEVGASRIKVQGANGGEFPLYFHAGCSPSKGLGGLFKKNMIHFLNESNKPKLAFTTQAERERLKDLPDLEPVPEQQASPVTNSGFSKAGVITLVAFAAFAASTAAVIYCGNQRSSGLYSMFFGQSNGFCDTVNSLWS